MTPHDDWRSWFKLASRQDFDVITRLPSPTEIVERRKQEVRSGAPLRSLGFASDGEIILSEEARESHMHLMGAPGEGKSKLLELLVRQDVQRGYGSLVLDPSDNGDTVYKILRYCCKVGFEKVILIDPHDAYKLSVVPTINPIHYSDVPPELSSVSI